MTTNGVWVAGGRARGRRGPLNQLSVACVTAFPSGGTEPSWDGRLASDRAFCATSLIPPMPLLSCARLTLHPTPGGSCTLSSPAGYYILSCCCDQLLSNGLDVTGRSVQLQVVNEQHISSTKLNRSPICAFCKLSQHNCLHKIIRQIVSQTCNQQSKKKKSTVLDNPATFSIPIAKNKLMLRDEFIPTTSAP